MKPSVPVPAAMRVVAVTVVAETERLPVLASCVVVPEVVPEAVPEDVVVAVGVVVAVLVAEGVADVEGEGVADAVGLVVPEPAAFTVIDADARACTSTTTSPRKEPSSWPEPGSKDASPCSTHCSWRPTAPR